MNSMYPKKLMTQADLRNALSASVSVTPPNTLQAPKTALQTGGRRIQVRSSGVHGKGVYALATIPKGAVVVEYKGEVISWDEALRRHPHDPSDPDHTFYFHVDETRTIDGKVGGNMARWINHGCQPNCEADEVDGRIFIKALRTLKPGEELFYDYGLVIDERYTAKLKKQFECRCGKPKCRGTMLAPKVTTKVTTKK
jgi:uncharacterized protein